MDFVYMLAFLAVIAGPVILVWGIIRALFFGSIKVAGEIAGGQAAVATGSRGWRRGTILIVIGLVLIGYAALVFWLA